jgi:methylmalonyl-CoA mutase N-terminal domain/subunit
MTNDFNHLQTDWEENILQPFLKKTKEQRERFETLSHIPVERLYLPDDIDDDYAKDVGFPGQYPFTRGIYPTMYRGRLWTMRQYAGYATAEETNARYKFLLSQGQTGLSIAFDLPTQIGYDADDPIAAGEVGKVGVSISSLADMERLFDGIPLDQVSTSMTINAPAAILLAMYIAVGKKQGVPPEKLRGTVQNDILKEYVLEEVAKFRAARRLWASLMHDRFGARDPKSMMLRFHTQTAGVTLTAQQPVNNVARVTLQALASVLGGTQSLHTNSMDEALALPTEEAVQVALRTQQIIAYESGVADTVDPLAGSYYVEKLTDEIEARSRDYLDRIDAMGGALAAIEAGYIQREIQESAYRYQKAVEAQAQIVVGVNRFQAGEARKPRLMRVDESAWTAQVERLHRLRAERDDAAVKRALTALQEAAQAGANLMPPILNAVEAYATTGEICNILRRVFGEYHAPTTL